MMPIYMYILGFLVLIGVFVMGALFGSTTGVRQERKRCGDIVKDHLCSQCYTRHCLLKMASQIRLVVVNDHKEDLK